MAQPADPIVAPVPGRLPLPAAVSFRRVDWLYVYSVIGFHLAAALAFIPWFFSWTGVILVVVGIYVFGTLGINICYHRLLTHKGFRCVKWLEHTFAILGVCSYQDTPAHWVAVHRRHHYFADRQEDPHSPLVNFLWGHVAWMLVENEGGGRLGNYERWSKDVLRDPFYVWLERNNAYSYITLASWFVFFAGGFVAELLLGGSVGAATQFGLSLVVWGCFVRTIVVWHGTWSVNSVTHLWGYRNYQTDENSRNNPIVAALTHGEGWHNNHHADQQAAKHGHRWWEFDLTYLVIRGLARLGLVHDIVMPNPRVLATMTNGRPAR
jgi:fatty-acid desaturase